FRSPPGPRSVKALREDKCRLSLRESRFFRGAKDDFIFVGLNSCRRPLGPRSHVEQPENVVLRQTQRRRRAVLADHLLKELPFLLQYFRDALLDRSLADEARDEHRLLLAQTMRPVDRLVLDGGIPPAVEEKDIVGELEVEADAAGPVTHEQHVLGRVLLEQVEDRLALAVRHLAMKEKRPVRRQGGSDFF